MESGKFTMGAKLIMGSSIPLKDLTAKNILPNESWDRVVAKLRFTHGEITFNSWLKPLRLEELDKSQVTLSVPTRFMREWILSHYMQDINNFWKEESPSIKSINILVKTPSAEESTNIVHDSGGERISSVTSSSEKEDVIPKGVVESALDPRFTFDNFVVGPTNELAHAAARSVAEAEEVVPGSNPLFLYGGVGLGKTHLMHAIAWHIRNTNPERRVIYLSAEKFMYQFIRALRNKDIVAFKEYFRSVDVLMIDDIQFICGKNSTQEEFFHTFNALIDNNRQLIISGDRSPSDLDGMEERVRSRLGWGLAADINSTTYELRLGILQSKVENMQVNVPAEVLEFLARKISSNVRELEGALNKVIAHSSLIKREITLQGTQEILFDILRCNERCVTIEDIKQTVAEHCNIRVSDMHSSRRARNVARPRQIAMFLSKRLTTCSLPEIGRKFGGKDHTTVMHAVKRVEQLCNENKEIRNDVDLLLRMLQS